ncbi:3884_t:CDS:10 [Acaulospora morrowiae]|uniref:3884_t:CDS:1 n=1 Tax=Acaulospora morrowiae TaxID=94023 RepID=A0A9N8ZAB1_9GLOM|nr:3884_t:CDS:10 [Acaulospora morrowiae]
MLTWVRDNLKSLKPKNFYERYSYSHTSRKHAEEKLRELLTAIKNENNSYNRKLAICFLDSFEPWTQSIDCEKYWLNVEVLLRRSAHEVLGRNSAYETIKNFVKKINDEEETLDEFQPPSKRFKEDEQSHTPENKIRAVSYGMFPNESSPGMTTTSLYVPSSPDSITSEDFIKTEKHSYLVVKKCESMAVILSAIEELALSHVFVFQEESPHGLCEYFDDELWEELFVEFRKLYPYASIPEKIYDLSSNIIKIASEGLNYKERQTIARRYLRSFETTTEEEEIMIEIFSGLVNNEHFLFMRNNNVEDTHAIQNVNSIIVRPFFKSSRKITFEGANKMCESSAIAKRRFDPVLLGTKPDFTVMTTNPKKHVELLIGEVKPQKTRDALVSEDLVSLGKMMKNALDKSIKDGIDDLVICGLQVIGFVGRAYVMDLRFEGIYRMILIGEFELPRGFTSWGSVLRCYRVLNTIRVMVNNMATLYQSAIRMNIKQTQSEKIKLIKPIPKLWTESKKSLLTYRLYDYAVNLLQQNGYDR